MFEPLLNHIQKFVPLTADEQELVVSYLKYEELGKKQFMFSEGDTCNAQYFVMEGCVRMYFIKDNGVEQIVQFGIDNWWIADYMSFTMHTPSKFFLQTVQRSKMVVLKQDKQEELLDRLPKLERYFRRVYQKAYAAAQTRVLFHADLSGEEKYHHFASRFPDFVQRIPQYMLASYLGFSPEFLSRVRAKDH
ncbi:Crp/Fnr family transcriptional regulator [Mucilaginibacter terrae]|uniref:CRP/FNR family transcriptional regulator n=1 Tax=Mucilaginibacter terrae TaxID=1955052 RepID=A0ABU3GY36_9SPHI|nr:Crp/Fnr family transcriptional regulator [Mucilaginibacter terrae]MDT3404678.1 CRP/FNR family transcriptional regulator [Mucilaginibacter terrae]